MSESTTRRVAMVWDQHERPKYDLLLEWARGYMHAAIVIFEKQQGAKNPTFYNLLPGVFNLIQSLELFLKAAICLRGKRIPTGQTGHNLECLHSQYHNLFSDEKFAFKCPIGELIEYLARFSKYGQYARYPFDTKGNIWRPNEDIPIELNLKRIRELSQDFERLEPALRKAKPLPP